MKLIFTTFLWLFLAGGDDVQSAYTPTSAELEGRWNITIDIDGTPAPSWLEITRSGTQYFVGRVVGPTGSARPISQVFVNGNRFNFRIPPQWEETSGDFSVEGRLEGETLKGTLTTGGRQFEWIGKRAPSLLKSDEPKWGTPIQLFNGKDLTGWTALGNRNQWVVENGVLKSPASGANLMTNQKFADFKLQAEFRYPKGSNSGIYLRGRYEVQIQDDYGKEPSNILFGGVYGFVTPNEMAAKPAGEWQSFEITLVGRKISVVANGKTIVCNQLIPGITGGALDSNEGEPGPIYLQGDHGPIEFRNIILTPAK